MKEFFKMFFASILGVITAGIILFCIFLFIFFGIVAGIASKATGGTIPKIEANSILHIDNSSFPEIVSANPWSMLTGKDESVSLSQAVEAIGQAKNNPNITGIFLDLDNLSVGMASAEELRRALQDFKMSGKFVVSYADRYTQRVTTSPVLQTNSTSIRKECWGLSGLRPKQCSTKMPSTNSA